MSTDMHSLYNHVCDRETRTYVPVLAIYPRPTPGTLNGASMGCRTFLRPIPAGGAHGHVRCNTLLPQVKNIVTEKDTKETMGPGIENYIYTYLDHWWTMLCLPPAGNTLRSYNLFISTGVFSHTAVFLPSSY